jgi:sporulation-control protein spo0M
VTEVAPVVVSGTLLRGISVGVVVMVWVVNGLDVGLAVDEGNSDVVAVAA